MDFNQEQKGQSEFNMAVSYLYRLNAIISFCNDASLNLDLYNWFHGLNTFYREVSTEMNIKEQKEVEAQIQKIEPLLTTYINTKYKYGSSELYKSLSNFELDLRKVLKDSGLLMKMKQDPKFALG